MLNMQEAVKKAKFYAKELYADEDIKDLSLEEIDFDDQHDNWKVTLGYNTERHKIESNARYRTNLAMDYFANLNTEKGERLEMIREYKIFEINAHDGKLIKMMIRPL